MTPNKEQDQSAVTVPNYLEMGQQLLDKTVSPHFYESESDFLEVEKTLTDNEKILLEAMCWFLPRHMAPYDWNMPFACEIIKMVRESNAAALHEAEVRGAEKVRDAVIYRRKRSWGLFIYLDQLADAASAAVEAIRNKKL